MLEAKNRDLYHRHLPFLLSVILIGLVFENNQKYHAINMCNSSTRNLIKMVFVLIEAL